MINSEVNEIMCDYVTKANDFCQSYEKEVLAKKYSCMSSVIEAIYSELEGTLYNLADDTKAKIEIIYPITANKWGKDIESLKEVENDLFTASKYYTYMYSARIAEGLAKQWRAIASGAVLGLLTNELKRNGGVDNGEH